MLYTIQKSNSRLMPKITILNFKISKIQLIENDETNADETNIDITKSVCSACTVGLYLRHLRHTLSVFSYRV